MQAVLGPLVGATVVISRLSDRGNPGAVPVFTTTTGDGTTLATAGTFDVPQNLLVGNEIYVVTISGGIDVDPDDDGIRELPGQEFEMDGVIHALAMGSDLLNFGDRFRVNALTEVAYQIVLNGVPNEANLTAAFVTSQLDRHAALQLVDASSGGDLNGDGTVNRLDLPSFRPAEDQRFFVHGEEQLHDLTEFLLEGGLAGSTVAEFGTTRDPIPGTFFGGFSNGQFEDDSLFAGRCELPPAGSQSAATGTSEDEKNWLRSWSNDAYLWFDEIVDVDPAGPETTAEYFELMKTLALRPNGREKDRYHFSRSRADYLAFFQAGVVPGYGFELTSVSADIPREVRIAFVEPNTPAAAAGLKRGFEVTHVDTVDLRTGVSDFAISTIVDGLLSPRIGDTHTFTVVDPATNIPRNVQFVVEGITTTPVQNVKVLPTATGPVGYLTFNDHITPAEQGLIDAVIRLRDAQVVDLIVDLRYNGGGYLVIAQEFASMVAGPARVANQVYEQLVANSKHQWFNQVILFSTTVSGLAGNVGAPLPGLDLDRVFVITGPGTCSASETFINGLRGAGIEVVQIGESTCGKPFAFAPGDNCGVIYSSITYRGLNAQGWGGFDDGFVPGQAAGPSGVMPGCRVADDLSKPLGDPQEGRLAAALAWRNTRSCPTPTGRSAARHVPGVGIGNPHPTGFVVGPPSWRQSAFVRP